jgi:hypothetical protein
MQPDPILDEIHEIRQALSKESGDDIRKIAEAARVRQARSGRRVVTLPPRKAKLIRKASSLPHPG